MKVSVCVAINYVYEVDAPEEIDGSPVTADDLLFLTEADDPVYEEVTKIFHRNNIPYDGNTISIVNDETGEVIWST